MYRLAVLSAWLVLITGCATSPSAVQPLTSPSHNYMVSEREVKLYEMSEKAHKKMVSQGLLLREKSANQYLNQVGLSLVPDFDDRGPSFSFYIVKKSSVNAFAMPNGNIYMHVGLLSKLENEAQLAHVLGHEIAHVIQRHSYKGRLDRHNTVVAAHVADLFLFGTGLAYIPAGMNLASYSREQERESDQFAIEYVATQNYDLNESVKLFSQLGEVKHQKETGSIWSSHPDSSKRLMNSRQQISESYTSYGGEVVNHDKYEVFRREVAEVSIKRRISGQQYELAEDAVKREIKLQGDSALWQYYLGEIYRLRAKYPDAAAKEHAWLYDKKFNKSVKSYFTNQIDESSSLAEGFYREALVKDSDFKSAQRGYGLLSMAQENYAKAKEYFKEYLDSDNKPRDWRYIESLIKKIDKGIQ
jgi:beta-barrel assembly-enhancing protease